jgi:hypothetical protein
MKSSESIDLFSDLIARSSGRVRATPNEAGKGTTFREETPHRDALLRPRRAVACQSVAGFYDNRK